MLNENEAPKTTTKDCMSKLSCFWNLTKCRFKDDKLPVSRPLFFHYNLFS